jgi:hypothetical protein
MSGPEPAETLSFVFERLELEYQRTDPFTGKKMGATSKALNMENYAPAEPTTAQSGGSADGGPTTTSTSTSAAAAAAAAGGSGNGDGAPASNGSGGTASPTEAAVSANFPGLWGGNGFGILPD